MTKYLALGLLLTFVPPARAVLPEAAVGDSIVKIYTIQDRPDYYNPWSMRGPRSGTGSGCIIKGRRILTNAHVVSDQTFIQVRRHGEARRYEAEVVSVSHEADLALLTVRDPSFFEGVEALDLGELPHAQQEVLVYGFPLGGDTLSITKGVVSRVEHQVYAHSSSRLLAGQIDAAINPGNSGGPVLVDDKVVGVVMQAMSQADNIGSMVPVNVLKHFLADLDDGHYDGLPSLGVILENMENPALKEKYGLPVERTGVMVVRALPGSPADGRIFPGDILLAVEGHAVADNGTVEFREKERTSVSYLIQEKQLGETASVTVWHEGEEVVLEIPLTRSHRDDPLVELDSYDRMPDYYIYGGLVFCPLTKDLLKAWGSNWYNTAPKDLAAKLSNNYPEREGEEVVVLLKVLPADVNRGYHNYGNWMVEKVNGQRVLNLRDLMERVESATGPYVVFENRMGLQLILDREQVALQARKILQVYRVPSDRSDDLKPEPAALQ